ncbi:IS1380 family transposase ISDre2 [Sporomusa carbonis]
MEKPREVWLDFDDSVVTVFGEQGESAVGYNPRYHGRRSYKVKVAFISGTGELVYSKLYDRKTASNGQFREFLEETLAKLDQGF